jgi:hypothetical protein
MELTPQKKDPSDERPGRLTPLAFPCPFPCLENKVSTRRVSPVA